MQIFIESLEHRAYVNFPKLCDARNITLLDYPTMNQTEFVEYMSSEHKLFLHGKKGDAKYLIAILGISRKSVNPWNKAGIESLIKTEVADQYIFVTMSKNKVKIENENVEFIDASTVLITDFMEVARKQHTSFRLLPEEEIEKLELFKFSAQKLTKLQVYTQEAVYLGCKIGDIVELTKLSPSTAGQVTQYKRVVDDREIIALKKK